MAPHLQVLVSSTTIGKQLDLPIQSVVFFTVLTILYGSPMIVSRYQLVVGGSGAQPLGYLTEELRVCST